VSPYSIVHDLLAFSSGPDLIAPLAGTALFSSAAPFCCNTVFGGYLNTSGPWANSLKYTVGSAHAWTGISMELKAVTNCNTTPTDTPTPLPTSTHTPTRTVTYSPTPPGTFTFSPTKSSTYTVTKTYTLTYTYSDTPTPPPTATNTPILSPTPTVTVSVTLTPVVAPDKFKIVAVYPNPINLSPGEGGTFVLRLSKAGDVAFTLFSLRGELVWQHTETYDSPGTKQYFWEAKNSAGAPVSYGAYYLIGKANTGGSTETDGKWISVLR
jgi:hypothetical protein